MSDLIARIRAEIDLDEQLAREAYAAIGTSDGTARIDDQGRMRIGDNEWAINRATSAHILRHPPGRTIAMVAAHRKILDEHPIETRADLRGGIEYGCACSHWCETGGDFVWGDSIDCPVILAIAACYGVPIEEQP